MGKRRLHGVMEVEFDPELAKTAQAYAKWLALGQTDCFFPPCLTHSWDQMEKDEYSENLAANQGQPTMFITTPLMSEMWYTEVDYYDYCDGGKQNPGKRLWPSR